MTESPVPTPTSAPPSIPPPSAIEPRSPRRGELRASLRSCSAEGLAADVAGACFGTGIVTAWGVELGVSPVLLGIVWGLPYFGQLLQLPATWLTAVAGRKRVALVAHGAARQVTLPLAVLPFVDLTVDAKRAALVALFALSSILSVVGHNAWLAWVGELVPTRIRGRYFGRRTAMCTVVATITSLAVAAALDAGRARGRLGVVLAAVVLARSAAGLVAMALMRRQRDVPSPQVRPALHDVLVPFTERAPRRLLAFRAAWSAATGLSASASAIYVVNALGLGFMGMATYTALVALLQVITTPLWGRMLDRAGARPVLVACSFGMAASSALWVGGAAGNAWLLALDALASGLLIGGQELALFTMPLRADSSARRPMFVAIAVMVGGVTYGVASIAGGAIASVIPVGRLLALSTAGRLIAAMLALRLLEPGARGIGGLVRALGRGGAATPS